MIYPVHSAIHLVNNWSLEFYKINEVTIPLRPFSQFRLMSLGGDKKPLTFSPWGIPRKGKLLHCL